MKNHYPWHFLIRWPYYYSKPSIRKHTKIDLLPISQDFSDKEFLRILFLGDMMTLAQLPTLDSSLKSMIADADFVILNCEAPVGSNYSSKGLTFQHSKDFISEFLNAFGIQREKCIMSIANNHIDDYGLEGIDLTLQNLKELGITAVGYKGKENRILVKK
jgi:hypothetical protein